ncbi:DUF1330 domain-containing protein [Microbulbifer sp. ZKSA006]|uniref:DUF1330 domain-containing protein n=1 Tax=Microbulbifer sp. ZKSA006 TaxID=3243390 RepID=UPI0040396127
MLPVFLHIESSPNPQETQALQAYLSKIPALIQRYGGVPIASYEVEEALDGGESAQGFAVLSFPDRAAIHALFNDTAYRALIPLRDRAFAHLRFYITSERIELQAQVE